MLVKSQVDVIVVDTAHGHSTGCPRYSKGNSRAYPNLNIIAGNVATAEATRGFI